MKFRFRFAMFLAVLLAATTNAFSREIKYDYDHHANFSQYKTYSWAKVDMPDPIWNDRVKEAVDKQLSAKGWTEVPSGGDVSIVAVGMTHEKPTLQTFYDGFDGWGWGGFQDAMATTTVQNYEVGTLVIDMFDSRTKKLIWRGSASDTISDKPEKNMKDLDKSVEKLFDHFPPRA
jgi:hypothetical protein